VRVYGSSWARGWAGEPGFGPNGEERKSCGPGRKGKVGVGHGLQCWKEWADGLRLGQRPVKEGRAGLAGTEGSAGLRPEWRQCSPARG